MKTINVTFFLFIINQIVMSQNSDLKILARGCDPQASLYASQQIPPMIGNPQYIPTTTDDDFIQKIKTEKWDVIFFAPGACRFSAAKMKIHGGNQQTKSWTLEEYKALVYQYQGKNIQIVETTDERETVTLLKAALSKVVR